jgi:arginyl-tRNA synthetase
VSDLQTIIESQLRAAVVAALGDQCAGADPMVRPAVKDRPGDYQANLAMGLAKKLHAKPRELAQQIADKITLGPVIANAEVAGPGFINLTLADELLNQFAADMLDHHKLGVQPASQPVTIVVDYCGPTIAKQMHVGHLRSCIIGDCIARTLTFVGQTVLRQNHLGDWGLQMGMVTRAITQWQDLPIELNDNEKEQLTVPGRLDLALLEKLYRAANQMQENDPDERAKMIEQTRQLQNTPQDQLTAWKAARDVTLQSVYQQFDRLGMTLKPEHERGESFYADQYQPMIDELRAQGFAESAAGAVGVFADGFVNKDGEPRPFIIQSRDGTFQYPTFDLAAIRYRAGKLQAQRIIYTHDSRQGDHFAMLFAVARKVGYIDDSVQTDFAPFGTVLGPDRRPFKTRSGQTVKLSDLLDEAEARAATVIDKKTPDLPPEDRRRIAHVVGIGALKYADLSNDRAKDYVFDWDRMLAMEGNTAPYLQNAFVRISSIFRKGKIDLAEVDSQAISIAAPAERALVLLLLQWPRVIELVADSLEPHRLCNYLYDLASEYHRFYEQCPVLKADNQPTLNSRLALCRLVSRTLETGLNLLGIDVVEQM